MKASEVRRKSRSARGSEAEFPAAKAIDSVPWRRAFFHLCGKGTRDGAHGSARDGTKQFTRRYFNGRRVSKPGFEPRQTMLKESRMSQNQNQDQKPGQQQQGGQQQGGDQQKPGQQKPGQQQQGGQQGGGQQNR